MIWGARKRSVTMRRWIMHVDMDAFFASIEQLDHPDIKATPLLWVVFLHVASLLPAPMRLVNLAFTLPCPYLGLRNSVLMASMYIRAWIVTKRYPIRFFLLWKNLLLTLSHYLSTKPSRGKWHVHHVQWTQATGRAIKDRVFEETGLIISAGLAPNKFLAKLASDLDKPDGLVVIPYGREKEIFGATTY